MRFVQLGKSSLQISRVGLGTMGLGGYFHRDESRDCDVVRVLQKAIDTGVSLIDTAEIYGEGHAETLVGRAMKGRRSEIVIATKFSPEHSDYQGVMDAAERSLTRLQTDFIDLYQTHWPNPRIPFEETIKALQALLVAGKIRTVGLSNATLKQMHLAQAAFPPEQFVSLQQQYNLADRYVEVAQLPFCVEHGCTLLAYSPLLEGKLAPDDARRYELERLAREAGLSPGQLILVWLLRLPEVVVIPKAGSVHHLDANLAAAEITLPPDLITALNQLYLQQIVSVVPSDIDVADAANRKVCKTEEEARANTAGMSPSPMEVAEELQQGENFKPIKVSRKAGSSKPYQLTEGRLRYWAWVIAFGEQKPVPCFLV